MELPSILPAGVLPDWELFLLSALYLGLLFALAWWGDRRAAAAVPLSRPWTYSLALAVYCTSWTFYVAVGRATSGGWDYLPIYLGPLLVWVLGLPLLSRLVALCKRHNITSVADFIGARYGRRRALAALVTVIAVLGILPYIALQLRAIDFSFGLLGTGTRPHAAIVDDHALWLAVLLAAFSILFGTRQVASTENHHGLVLAIAFESVIKLAALLAVGAWVTWGVFGGPAGAAEASAALPSMRAASHGSWWAGFVTQTLLAACAIVCLPRQFHVTVVENLALRDLRTARRVFPVYLALVSVFVLPIAAAGALRLGDAVAADTYVLSLPLAAGHELLALLAYFGGFSAATSMVIVATIALATMVSNELLVPLLLRRGAAGAAVPAGADFAATLRNLRRVCIVVLVLAAYGFHRGFAGGGSLAGFGLLSFAAVLQFAPALFGGLYWRGASIHGVLCGLGAGFTLWLYCLLLPTVVPDAGFVTQGPFALQWLRPQALFGGAGLDPLTHGALWSLAANLAGYVGVSRLWPPRLRDRLHAAAFLGEDREVDPAGAAAPGSGATVGDLQALMERFLGRERAAEFFGTLAGAPQARAPGALLRRAERALASVLGAASARLAITSALGHNIAAEDLIALLDETSHALQFSRELLQATLEHMPQGVSVVDSELRLVAWNRRYTELFAYPPGLVRVGVPIEALIRDNARRGLLPADEEQVAKRLALMRAGRAYLHERELPGGSVLEIRGNPMPGGGFVTSYADVSAYKRAQRDLQDANESLERRVAERTRDADAANAAKTRFLAAASHDLVQPVHAARLFLAALERHPLAAEPAQLVANLESSLGAAEGLLGALLDISRLDAGALVSRPEHFALARVLEPLAREFGAQAAAHGLRFRFRGTRAVVRTDPALLRRVLQNFLSNALRYTARGRILLGCRHLPGGGVRVEVHDTGPGIPAAQQREIFEEFRRLPAQARGERGLGLGLAIAERIARLLAHPLTLRSHEGRGSAFRIELPAGDPAAARPAAAAAGTHPPAADGVFAGRRVLCLDNEPAVLGGLQSLLSGWGCVVLPARDEAEALLRAGGVAPDVVLIDFHLDAGASGIEVMARLCAHWGRRVPGVVITADHTAAARAAAQARGHALLQKPLRPAALRALLARTFEGG